MVAQLLYVVAQLLCVVAECIAVLAQLLCVVAECIAVLAQLLCVVGSWLSALPSTVCVAELQQGFVWRQIAVGVQHAVLHAVPGGASCS